MLGALLARHAGREAFDAMNRMEVDALLEDWADDAVFEYPGRSTLAGRFEGKEAIRDWFVQRFARLQRVHYTLVHVSVAELFALGGTNTLLVEWLLTEERPDGTVSHLSGVTSAHLHAGKVVQVRDYVFEQDLLEATWGTSAAAA
jgi:uncharacterized protein